MAQVIVYSTPTCTYCKAAKEFFMHHNIAFQEYDVSVDRAKLQDMIDRSGQRGVPVIFVDDEMVIGFDKERLMELLGIKE